MAQQLREEVSLVMWIWESLVPDEFKVMRMDKLTKGESTVKKEKAKERNLRHSTFRDLPKGESGDWGKVLVRQKKTKYQRSLEKKVM